MGPTGDVCTTCTCRAGGQQCISAACFLGPKPGPGCVVSKTQCCQWDCPAVNANCNRQCNKIYRPVCGTDGETYTNKCLLELETCKSGGQMQQKPRGACRGNQPNKQANCNGQCYKIYRPVCGTDGETYTNKCLLELETCKSGGQVQLKHPGACSI